MRTFFLILILVLLTSQNHNAQETAEKSSVVVLSSKWSKSHQKIENADNQANIPAQSAMTRTNRNFERNRRVNDPPGTPDPNEGTLEARSAVLEKTVQESRSSKSKIVDGFTYQAKIRNESKKTIEIVFWEYRFIERANPANVSSRQFLCGVNIKSNKEQELSAFSTFSPGNLISASSSDNKSGNLFEEKILINRVEYSDGTILQRVDWNYAEIKPSIVRALETPWGLETCRNL
ncbi:MAG TPA: hypothetical protein VF556_11075 [Pyrinomonadaceae bacterium]|jgi:hypothetical protein